MLLTVQRTGPLPGETTIDIFANGEAAGDGGEVIREGTVTMP